VEVEVELEWEMNMERRKWKWKWKYKWKWKWSRSVSSGQSLGRPRSSCNQASISGEQSGNLAPFLMMSSEGEFFMKNQCKWAAEWLRGGEHGTRIGIRLGQIGWAAEGWPFGGWPAGRRADAPRLGRRDNGREICD